MTKRILYRNKIKIKQDRSHCGHGRGGGGGGGGGGVDTEITIQIIFKMSTFLTLRPTWCRIDIYVTVFEFFHKNV